MDGRALRIRIPRALRESGDDAGSADLREWLAQLPELVSDLAARWALRLGEPYEPGGSCSWVVPAVDASGEERVLKVGWRHPEAAHEGEALRVWSGSGAVRVYAAETADRTSALLLERCTPGTSLGSVVDEPEQDVILAGLLKRLLIQPSDDHPFRPLYEMCDDWAAEFEAKFEGSTSTLDPGIARQAMTLFRDLPRSAVFPLLLCTDLHAGNVLAAQREPWLVIDPKPYLGDPAYDAVQHMLNCAERLVADPTGFAGRMADLLDLDARRLTLWLFARCVLECLDQPHLVEVAGRLAP